MEVLRNIIGLFKTLTFSDLFFFTTCLVLIILLVYVLYLIKTDEDSDTNITLEKSEIGKKKQENSNINIKDIIEKLDTEYKGEIADLSEFEEEQEKNAVISYEELVKKASNSISYVDNYDNSSKDIMVKKIDLTGLSDTKEIVNIPKAIMIDYDSEEDFLKALKLLQSNLIR